MLKYDLVIGERPTGWKTYFVLNYDLKFLSDLPASEGCCM